MKMTVLMLRAIVPSIILAAPVSRGDAPAVATATDLRTTRSLMQDWKFAQNDSLTDEAALKASGADWQTVNLPHTWNARDAAGVHVTKPYKRGIGWYRLEFDTPTAGARHWPEFGAASIVADVRLNGEKLGQHKAERAASGVFEGRQHGRGGAGSARRAGARVARRRRSVSVQARRRGDPQ